MTLATVMFIWAMVTIIIVGLCLTAFVPRIRNRQWKQSFKSLFDFSRGKQEAERIHDILTKALADSTNDSEFEVSYRRIAEAPDELGDAFSWSWLNRTLSEYRLVDEGAPSARVLAERYVKDIPRRYHLKDSI